MSRFLVRFKDKERLVINDIIAFDDDQMDQIKAIALDYTKLQIQKVENYGFDLSYLSNQQKQIIIDTKNDILSDKTSEALLDEDIVLVSLHSIERSLKRLGSNNLDRTIYLVDKLKKVDVIIKAQFKGYSTLSYTTMENHDPDEFILPISFVIGKKMDRVIKIITVIPKVQLKEREEMEASIAELDPNMAEMMEKLKKRLRKD